MKVLLKQPSDDKGRVKNATHHTMPKWHVHYFTVTVVVGGCLIGVTGNSVTEDTTQMFPRNTAKAG